jgi:hypothetical protein
MIRGLLTIGFVLFLAAAAIWGYRHYGHHLPDLRQAELIPAAPKPQQDAPAPPPLPDFQPTPEAAPPTPPVPEPAPLQNQPQPPADPQPAPEQVQPAPTPEPAPNPPTPRVGKRTHLVRPGETLWQISCRYFNSPAYVEQIADANHMDAPNNLRPGMVLVLPEVPGLPSRVSHTSPPARPTPDTEHVTAPQREAPMPPTLSRTVTSE